MSKLVKRFFFYFIYFNRN